MRPALLSMAMCLMALLFLADEACGQRRWIVNNQGALNADFADVQQAVNAAAPGDEVLVFLDPSLPWVGDYVSPVVAKPVRITGTLVGGGSPGVHQINFQGPLVVTGIPAGQRVEIHGFVVGELQGASSAPAAIVVLDCAGDILLDSVSLDGGFQYVTPTFLVQRSQRVTFRGGEIFLQGAPFLVEDSTVLLTNAYAQYDPPAWYMYYPHNSESIRVRNSDLTVVGSVLYGPDYTTVLPGFFPEREAILVESGTCRIGPGSYVRGGLTGIGSMRNAGVAVQSGVCYQDSRAVVNNVSNTVPQQLDVTYHSWVVANEAFGVAVAGPANGFALLAFGDWLPDFPSPLGPLAMDPTTILPVDLVPLSAIGTYQWSLTCPLSAPVLHAYAFQALTLAPSGAIGVTVPSPLTVAWPRNVIP